MWKCPICSREFKRENQNHSCGKMPADIDEYISTMPEDVQVILNKIREAIRAAAPDSLEKISWGMPTFWQGENLIHFAAFKKHIGIYPGDMTNSPFDERLAGYLRTKGGIRFELDTLIDYELIADIARWRVSRASLSGK